MGGTDEVDCKRTVEFKIMTHCLDFLPVCLHEAIHNSSSDSICPR